MKHKAVITIEIDPKNTDEADIKLEMFPPPTKTQDNRAANVALAMIEFVGKPND